MIETLKDFAKAHWPALRLRTLVFAVLLFAAAMPAIGALALRSYENTLVRQTQAELTAQGAALAATAAAIWPGAKPVVETLSPSDPGYYRPEPSDIDLNAAPMLEERPAPSRPKGPPDLDALKVAAQMESIFDGTSRSTLASILLLDAHGRIVRGAGVGGELSALPEVKDAMAGRADTVLRRNGQYHPRYSMEWLSRASALRLHHARPVLVNGKVVGVLLLSRSPRALFRGLYEDRGKIALAVLVIIGLLIALSGLVSRGVTRPVEALSAATRAVSAGRGEVPETPPTAAIEIQALYEDFRSMAGAIARRSRYLRDFAAAVSHEFKTPLAGIGGAVELLQDHYETMSGAERGRFLANIAADNDRLSQLVARLLDLARADMARPDADAATDLAIPAHRIADALSEGAFRASVSIPAGLSKVAVPESTIEAVLGALVDNSRRAGALTARITGARDGDGVLLTVIDNGPGVAAADRDRLFEPFFTTRRADGGTGLGLAIARSLVEAHGGTIRLADAPSGARFEVTLPCWISAA